VSPRHLSFVELGKARPSPELLTLIADRLGVPLREQNDWLIAAGHAPRYPETSLDATALRGVRGSIQTLLDAHEPFPAVAIDRLWSVQLYNQASVRLADGIGQAIRGDPTNIFRVSLHPDGFAGRTRNFDEWSAYLLRQLDLLVRRTRSVEAIALAEEIARWPNIPPRETWSHWTPQADDPVVPWILEHGGAELSFFTTMATFGTPVDITLAELTVELFFPVDEGTEEHLRAARANTADLAASTGVGTVRRQVHSFPRISKPVRSSIGRTTSCTCCTRCARVRRARPRSTPAPGRRPHPAIHAGIRSSACGSKSNTRSRRRRMPPGDIIGAMRANAIPFQKSGICAARCG
jgi:transcriptional regulator with XRE-family HTH domain